MHPQAPPHPDPGSTLEALAIEHTRHSTPLLPTVLATLTLILILLPWIQLDITARARGILRSPIEQLHIHAPANAILERILVSENERVRSNQVLFIFRDPDLEERLQRCAAKHRQTLHDTHDLEALCQPDPTPEPSLQPRFLAELKHATARHHALQSDLAHTLKILDRTRHLTDEKLASQQELERDQYLVDQATAALHASDQAQQQSWFSRLHEARDASCQLASELQRLQHEAERLIVHAPAAGTLLGLDHLVPSQYFPSGSTLATLSPYDTLLAATTVPSRHISHLHPNQTVRLHMDGFPQSEWGTLPGNILRIASDAQGTTEPAYQVLIRPASPSMDRPNGPSIPLRPGMTFEARFVTARRSLAQVLYQRVEQWTHQTQPAQSHNPINL